MLALADCSSAQHFSRPMLSKPSPYGTIGLHGGSAMAIRRITRRQFVATLGSAAAWPVVARAQQPTMPVIGFLGISSREKMGNGVLLDFKRGLAETGYVEGQNVTIEYRWAEEQFDRLRGLATELVQRGVAS